MYDPILSSWRAKTNVLFSAEPGLDAYQNIHPDILPQSLPYQQACDVDFDRHSDHYLLVWHCFHVS